MTCCQFEAHLQAGGPSFMPTQVVLVPPLELAALGSPQPRRVVGTINGYAVRLGLLPLPGGGRYLMLNKDLCQRIGAQVGQRLTLALAPDPTPDQVDMPAELAEALEAWPEAAQRFQQLSGSMRRAVAQHVQGAKQAETRIRRAVEITERLGRGGHPFRKA